MDKNIAILLIGATGNVGHFVLDELKARGYTNISVFIRTHSKTTTLPDDNFKLIIGDATDQTLMANFVPKYDVVINCIGARRIWSPNSLSSTKAIVPYLKKKSLYITLSALGVKKSFHSMGRIAKFIFSTALQPIMRDKARMEEYIQTSHVPFVILRPGGIIESDTKVGVPVVKEAPSNLSGTIQREYVARILVDFIEKPETHNKIWEAVEIE